MISLFPEERIEIAFNSTYVKNINGNKKEYYIGVEQGIIRKFNGSTFSGYEFLSENGSKYFISTTKSQIPQNYDAVCIHRSKLTPQFRWLFRDVKLDCER